MTSDRKYTAQEIVDTLRDMIISLAIMPGSRVTETQLAEYFAVSRTPIRAALQRLETEGYVTVKAKQGCFIRNIDMVKVSQYYDVRVVLENLVLTEIGNLKDNSLLHELAQMWSPDTMIFGAQVTDELKFAEEEFHLQLARVSRNPVLVNYIADINDQIRVVRRLGWPDTKSVTDTYEEHHRICNLLLHNDLPTAQSEMTNHIRKSQDLCSRITLHQLYGDRKPIRFD